MGAQITRVGTFMAATTLNARRSTQHLKTKKRRPLRTAVYGEDGLRCLF